MKKDVLSKLIAESSSYGNLTDIEKLMNHEGSLEVIPLQPLYLSILSATAGHVATLLPRLSIEQRRALIHIDFWNKDDVDVGQFEKWLAVYSQCRDEETVSEFVRSETFLLFLKSRLNIYTFDAEDPYYPDHDYYFLTEDNLLLVEYDEGFNYSDEVKFFIKALYSDMGVENAYSYLFKMMNDSFFILQEDNFEKKKYELSEFGFVDYFSALKNTTPLPSIKRLDAFIQSHQGVSASLVEKSMNQSLHAKMVIPFQESMEVLNEELAKVKSEKRQTHLQFNFIRTLNSMIEMDYSLQKGSVALGKSGTKVKNYINLGLDYLKTKTDEQSLFDRFDFSDLLKIGLTLVETTRKSLKKSVDQSSFAINDNEYFLGSWWQSYLDLTFNTEFPNIRALGVGKAEPVNNYKKYHFWEQYAQTLMSLLPFIEQFYNSFSELNDSGSLSDHFYLNYDVPEIDFESILISSYINHTMEFSQSAQKKMAITVKELKLYILRDFDKVEKEYLIKDQSHLTDKLASFIKTFGLDKINNIENYLFGLLSENLNSYEIDDLNHEDFKHVGGPILLSLS